MSPTTQNQLARTRNRARAPRRAFTILELLIVIGILLAIGGIVLINLIGAQDRADVGITKVQMQALEEGLQQFRVDMKRWPSDDEGVSALWSSANLDNEDDTGSWGGPYLEKPIATDQWGSEWVYRNPSEIEGLQYDLISLGPDREDGTDDDISIHDDIVGEDGAVDDEFANFATSSDGNG